MGVGGFDDEKETKNATKQQQRQQKTKKIETPSGDDILMAVARYRHRSTDNGNRIEEPRTPKEKQRERERERETKKETAPRRRPFQPIPKEHPGTDFGSSIQRRSRTFSC